MGDAYRRSKVPRRGKSFECMHPSDLAAAGRDFARSLRDRGASAQADLVKALSDTVAHQHDAIAYKGMSTFMAPLLRALAARGGAQ